MNFKIRLLGVLAICLALSCGTLGGIGPTFYFPTSKLKLEKVFSRMYDEHPEYHVPDSLKKYDNWSKRGYDFLEGRVLYFGAPPEELYYVTYIGDSLTLLDTTKIGIAIRAIYKPGQANKWLLGEELTPVENDRITNRFKREIIAKLEGYTKTQASTED